MSRRSASKIKGRCCGGCGGPITSGSRSGLCRACYEQVPLSARSAGNQAAVHAREAAEWYRSEGKTATQAAFEAHDFTKEIPLITGDVVACSDIHVPKHDSTWIARMVAVAKSKKITQLVIVGDLMDNEEISSYGASAVRPMSLAEGMLRTLQVLVDLSKQFSTSIDVIPGNHDDRITRLIRAAAESRSSAEKALAACVPGGDLDAVPYWRRYQTFVETFARNHAPKMASVVRWHSLPIMRIEGPPGCLPWLALHQATYSRHATTEAVNIWQREQCPIITTHTHHAGMRMAPNGRDVLMNIGCMTRVKYHRYTHERPKGGPSWDLGFATIIGGQARLYIDSPYTDHR